jgi:hypothetical protein
MKSFTEFRSGSDIKKADSWYKDHPEWGTPEATAKAKKMTPGQGVDEEMGGAMPGGANTGSVPDPSNIGPRKNKKSIVTRRYIEIMGKRKKQQP